VTGNCSPTVTSAGAVMVTVTFWVGNVPNPAAKPAPAQL